MFRLVIESYARDLDQTFGARRKANERRTQEWRMAAAAIAREEREARRKTSGQRDLWLGRLRTAFRLA